MITRADDVRLNIRVTDNTRNSCEEKYNAYTEERYEGMIGRRRKLGHINRWNRIISIILHGCGGIIAFIAGALNLWTLSIVSGVITVLGSIGDLVGRESSDMCDRLDNDLKSLKKYETDKSNEGNNPLHDRRDEQHVIASSTTESHHQPLFYSYLPTSAMPAPPPSPVFSYAYGHGFTRPGNTQRYL